MVSANLLILAFFNEVEQVGSPLTVNPGVVIYDENYRSKMPVLS